MKNALMAALVLFISVARAFPDPEVTDLLIGSVDGQVVEASSGEPVAYAAIVVKSLEDGSTVTGGITRDDGTFELKKLQAFLTLNI